MSYKLKEDSFGFSETEVDAVPSSQAPNPQRQVYDTLTPAYDTALPDDASSREYEEPPPAPTTAWAASSYDVNSVRSPQPKYATIDSIHYEEVQQPWDTEQYSTGGTFSRPPKPRHYTQQKPDEYRPDDIVAITHRMETMRLRGDYDSVIAVSPFPAPIQPIHSPSYYKRFKTFVWGNAQRRIATVVITSLVIGGIIGAYLGLSSSSSSSASTTPSPDSHNCTYPEGVNSTFLQLQETLSTVDSGLSIPGLDRATCSLISMVVNNTVNALKMGGYNCWQNVQTALMPLASSAIALNMDSIQQIITSVKQYCFASSTSSKKSSSSSASTTAMTTSAPMTTFAPVTSPANTVTTFTTTPTTSAPTTITSTTTTSGAGTTSMTTSTPVPTTVTTTITSTSPTTLRATTTSLVTTSTGKTTTLAPSTTTSTSTTLAPTTTTITVPAGTTTVTILAPTTTSTVFVSSNTSTTTTTRTTTTTTTAPTTTTVTSTTTTTTSTTATLPCCQLQVCLPFPFVNCRCSTYSVLPASGQACLQARACVHC